MIPKQPLVVAIVNDYEVVVAGVAAMLAPFVHRVSVVELDVGLAPAQAADVVLYDTFGQRRRVEDVVRMSNARRLVVYAWAGSDRSIADALAAGASGYAAKGLAAADLVDVLERVHAGEVVVNTGLSVLGEGRAGEWPGREHDLSPREAEIVALIARGLSNQDLADRSFLSVNTVKTYIRTAYRKMGVTNRSQAVIWALDRGFGEAGRAPGDVRRW